MKIFVLTALLFAACSGVFGQTTKPLKSLVSIENDHLWLGIDNPFSVVAQQSKPISIDQLRAYYISKDFAKVPIDIRESHGNFVLNPDSIGIIELHIQLADTTEIKSLKVKPLEAVARLGGQHSNGRIGRGTFKAQLGIMATVLCCNICATCKVLGYEIIRINNDGISSRVINKGGKFTEDARELIMRAESGDLYIFRRIKYQCHSTSTPQTSDDMIFEIE